jgi:hypothetical protein
MLTPAPDFDSPPLTRIPLNEEQASAPVSGRASLFSLANAEVQT